MKILIGIPVYNEEKKLPKLIKDLKKITAEIIVCNDGSTDNTEKVLENSGVHIINHKTNLGYGEAIKSIFNESRLMKYDILITFDGDGQHRVEDIEKITKQIENDEADIVIGSRFLDQNSKIPTYRKLGIKTITKLTNSSLTKSISDSQSGFRAYSKKVIDGISLRESGMGISTEILLKASKKGYRISEVPIIINYEGDTSTYNPISHGTGVVISTIKFISIEHPLKFYGIPGIVFLIFGISFIFWALQIYGDTRVIFTNITLIGVFGIIVGVILLITSVILFTIIYLFKEKYNE